MPKVPLANLRATAAASSVSMGWPPTLPAKPAIWVILEPEI